MKLKFKNKDKITLVMVASVEYTEDGKTIIVWDYTGDKVTIECDSVEEAETCVSALWATGQSELGEVCVFWH